MEHEKDWLDLMIEEEDRQRAEEAARYRAEKLAHEMNCTIASLEHEQQEKGEGGYLDYIVGKTIAYVRYRGYGGIELGFDDGSFAEIGDC